MRSRRQIAGVLIVVILMSPFGCATSNLPAANLPAPDDEVGAHPLGGWVRVDYEQDGTPVEISGELIAIDTDHMYVFDYVQQRKLEVANIQRARVYAFDADAAFLAGWATLGALSAISHGYGLVLSVPIWAFTGLAATSYRNSEAIHSYPDRSFDALSAYARFPQGPPPDLEKNTRL